MSMLVQKIADIVAANVEGIETEQSRVTLSIVLSVRWCCN